MSIQLREGKFDLVILAGPGVQRWPGIGVRALSTLVSESGLSVGLFGGEGLKVRGVLPSSGLIEGTGNSKIVRMGKVSLITRLARSLRRLSSSAWTLTRSKDGSALLTLTLLTGVVGVVFAGNLAAQYGEQTRQRAKNIQNSARFFIRRSGH